MTLELVSIHIPKTGGTSFWDAIGRHYGEALFVDNDHIPGSCIASPQAAPVHARAVHGHFKADAYREPLEAFRITFLRDPVEMFISGYFFWLVYPPHGNADHDRLLSEKPDILTYATHYAGRVLPAYFDGVDLNTLDYVGFADRRLQDYRTLSRVLGFGIEPRHHSNRTQLPAELEAERQSAANNPKLCADLRTALSADYYFYDKLRTAWA